MSEDERAIRDVVRKWMLATKEGDSETVLGLMADDVVFMVPGQKPFGKKEFASASQAMKGASIDGKSDILEIKVLGDWAFMRSHLEVTMTPTGGKLVRRSGHTLTLFRKGSSGKWLLARDANMLSEVNQ
jgi:uncharacterized protein (TIGR02246 family)